MNDLRDSILDIFEASLEAQLRAVRRLRQPDKGGPQQSQQSGMSQVDMAYDILRKARGPLHINEILSRIETSFRTSVDRESLVSSLSKKVARRDRFVRAEKNTFGLLTEPR